MMIKLFEQFDPEFEHKNDVKELLAQYPYLRYSISEADGEDFKITFSKDVKTTYIKKLFTSFAIEVLSESPVTIKIIAKKNISQYDEYKGKQVIGNIEKVSLPGLNLEGIEAKVDTGATTSSLHCSFIKIDTEKKQVTFIPLDPKYPSYKGHKFTYPLQELVGVRSSNGKKQNRALIKLKVKLRDDVVETFFSLSNRKTLEYPILLGKDLLSGYLIDSSLT